LQENILIKRKKSQKYSLDVVFLKVIETEYKGYKFRSRLEARWAVFFDACGIMWEYEPEGFELDNGMYYLPDFLLHNVYHYNDNDTRYCWKDLFVEVKARMNETDAKKIYEFTGLLKQIERHISEYSCERLLILSDIPSGDSWNEIETSIFYSSEDDETNFPFYGLMPFNFATIDCDWWTAYPSITKKGNFALLEDQTMINYIDEKSTEKAYRLARQARFEQFWK